MNRRFPIKYDLYRVPFNDGRGGKPEPITGASENGWSNALPRVTPDGRWVVFTRMESGFILQPTSRLFIVPAAGGEAREMNCNRTWMVFTSKALSIFTQLYLTHIDESGIDSVPVLLSRFHDEKYAAIVPHFLKNDPE